MVRAKALLGAGLEAEAGGALFSAKDSARLYICRRREGSLRHSVVLDRGVKLGEAAGVLDVLRVIGERRVRSAYGIALGQGYVTFSPLSAAADVCAIDHLCWTPIIPGPSGVSTCSV